MNSMNLGKNQKLLIFGSGSFDPFTNYHLRIIELVKQYFVMKDYHDIKVVLSLTPKTTNTNPDCTNTNDRVKMCKLATSFFSDILVDDWESSQRCYVILPKVLQYLSDKYRNNDEKIGVMLSDEQFTQLAHWEQDQVDSVIRKKFVICVTPNPHRIINFAQYCPKFASYEDNIHMIIDHANTNKPNIQLAVSNFQNIRNLVHPDVEKYIYDTCLYQDSSKDPDSSKLGIKVTPKNRIMLPRIRNTANCAVARKPDSSEKQPSKGTKNGKMQEDFLKVQRVVRTLPSIESAYTELMEKRRDYWGKF